MNLPHFTMRGLLTGVICFLFLIANKVFHFRPGDHQHGLIAYVLFGPVGSISMLIGLGLRKGAEYSARLEQDTVGDSVFSQSILDELPGTKK